MTNPVHICVHAHPPGPLAARPGERPGGELAVLDLAPQMLTAPLPLSFEEAIERLSDLPQMLIEPDGSFVYSILSGSGRRQLEGQLFDRSGQLLYVELKGECCRAMLERLLGALVGRNVPLVFQLVREGVFVDEAELQRLLAADEPR